MEQLILTCTGHPWYNAWIVNKLVLVVVQFFVSIVMIILTLGVFNQMRFMKQQHLGFNKEQVLVVDLPVDTNLANRLDHIKAELLSFNSVSKVSYSRKLPGTTLGELMFRIEQDSQLTGKGIKYMPVDNQFLDLMEIELIDGRNFSKDLAPDEKEAFIINEVA
ncbi:MAG: hypothetical protein IH946_06570, partial [Bacteroidetes bacterium]|nr:hypothetical protein [Bacteroidota bacterium]